MSDSGPLYYGKYRGIVRGNDEGRGRIRVEMPEFEGEIVALPSVPYAGDGVGLFLVPPENASVWVEFEAGNPEKPIWSGCFWEESDSLPADNESPDLKVLKTDKGTITIDDSGSGSLTIETLADVKVEMTSSGIVITSKTGTSIEITNGQATIKFQGPKVSINDQALEVT
jgi:uncharacterized protein involved in type VI secretion and phage assembly